ncbi:MAG: RluA family pseudouridine synthase [Myxococcaceae bacterium]|nr:RluA family pseudouridine synthase [Myxococcaceae bacterium]
MSDEASDWIEMNFTVEANYAGWRLDKYLCEKIQRLSRTRVQRIIARELVAPRPMKPSTLLTPGLTFQLRRKMLPEPEVPAAHATTELFRDDALYVVNKPAGLPVHPSARYHHGTLVEQLKARYGDSLRADPAHRLDRETSGVLVCGQSSEVSRRLMAQFVGGGVKKEYLAVVEGQPTKDSFEVEAAIAEGTELIRIAVRIDEENGRSAKTRFQVLHRFERDRAKFAVVQCFPETGRQHQIRVHLQRAGFPLVGDKIYGPDPGYFDRFSKKCLEEEAWLKLRLKRHALHAWRLSLEHPMTKEALTFEAPWPDDLREFSGGYVP